MGILLEDWMELNNEKETLLNSNLNLRAVTWADLHAVAELIYAVCEADGDTTVAVTPEELEHEWRTESFNLETDAFLVETQDGRVVGYQDFDNVKDHAHLAIDGYLSPRFQRDGH
jgi:hypothetical protein